jgi:alkylation response protein AidB-like acyl-CoA dehydrogenase
MYYALTDEQRALKDAVRDVVDAHANPRAHYPDPGEPTDDRAASHVLWEHLTAMGLSALLVPEEQGGSGAGAIELVLVAEELGRKVAAVPFLGSVCAAAALEPAADGDSAILLSALVGGRSVAFIGEPSVVQAQSVDGGWALTGRADLAIDAVAGCELVVAATTENGVGLFHTSSPELMPQRLIDHCRTAAAVVFDSTAGALLAIGEKAESGLRRARQIAYLTLAADSTGVADAILTQTADYARTRHQFGLPIGTFQAVKHRLADCLLLVENARSATWGGAWAVAEHWSTAPSMVAMAKARSTANAVEVAGAGVQLHGGIAVTWEHDMHIFLRRAKANEHLYGEPAEHLETIADRLTNGPSRRSA